MTGPFTPEEEAEFTPLNAAAFDLLRVKSEQSGEIPPVWLCMSDEAKEKARRDLYTYVLVHFPSQTREGAIRIIETSRSIATLTARWREAEAEFKRQRNEGNPRAFFAG